MKLILACDPNGGIGYNNGLPWDKLEGDLPRFKELTINKPVLMGRNTWDSLPRKPLPNRENYVMSSRQIEGANLISTLDQLTDIQDSVWVIGGAKLIESCWDAIDEIHLSRTYCTYTCDTFIDLDFISANYTLISRKECVDHSYEVWVKSTDTLNGGTK